MFTFNRQSSHIYIPRDATCNAFSYYICTFKEHPRSRAQLFFCGIFYMKEKTSSWGRTSPTNICSMSLALCPEVDETININYSCADKGRCRRHRMKTNRLKQKTGCTGEPGEWNIFQYFSSLFWLISHRGSSTTLWHQNFSLTVSANSEPHSLHEKYSAPEPWPFCQLKYACWLQMSLSLTDGPHLPRAWVQDREELKFEFCAKKKIGSVNTSGSQWLPTVLLTPDFSQRCYDKWELSERPPL